MIFQIVGFKNSGKTTLMMHAISFLKDKGYTVATIKHHGHEGEDIVLQNDKVDHMKHFNAGADLSIVQGHHYQQTVTRQSKQKLAAIIKESVTMKCDIILVEGFKHENYNKIIVYREENELVQLSKLTQIKGLINSNDFRAFKKLEKLLLELIKIEGMK